MEPSAPYPLIRYQELWDTIDRIDRGEAEVTDALLYTWLVNPFYGAAGMLFNEDSYHEAAVNASQPDWIDRIVRILLEVCPANQHGRLDATLGANATARLFDLLTHHGEPYFVRLTPLLYHAQLRQIFVTIIACGWFGAPTAHALVAEFLQNPNALSDEELYQFSLALGYINAEAKPSLHSILRQTSRDFTLTPEMKGASNATTFHQLLDGFIEFFEQR